MKSIFCITSLIFLTGCAGMLENRSFISEMDYQTDDMFVAGEDFDYVPGDSGTPHRSREEIRSRTPASGIEKSSRDEYSSLMRELSFKERKLSMKERALYKEVQPYLETESEKIYFLSLSPRERREYLESRRIDYQNNAMANRGSRGRRSLASLQPVYSGSLHLGMNKGDVVQTWGRPARVEVAGNPSNENERWAFYENGRVKFVYFEGGTVQGWQIQ
ncbi:MAG: hypothetical protein NXH75_12910 [Halobacteriovoraceae bacterium]|nr:hypothetical protein [Halobacteriovoraceae bacterium]